MKADLPAPYRLPEGMLEECWSGEYDWWHCDPIQELYVEHYGSAFVSRLWLEPLARWIGGRHCLEVMAGRFTCETAFRTTGKLYEVNPEALLIYLGHERDGFTAVDQVFDCFQRVNGPGFEQVSAIYDRFDDCHDRLHLGQFSPARFDKMVKE